jgi:hypothetical protein
MEDIMSDWRRDLDELSQLADTSYCPSCDETSDDPDKWGSKVASRVEQHLRKVDELEEARELLLQVRGNTSLGDTDPKLADKIEHYFKMFWRPTD